MRSKEYIATIGRNAHYTSGSEAIDLYPMLIGELRGPRGNLCGGVVWWNRYRMSGLIREAVLYPLIGVQIGDDRWRVDVTPSDDHRSLVGRWSIHGWESEIVVRPKGRGEHMHAEVTIMVHDRQHIIEMSDQTLPTEYFFPENPVYVPRALQAKLP